MPECTEVLGITTMNVEGLEHVRFADPGVADRTVLFTLTLVENIGSDDDAYAITLTDLAGYSISNLCSVWCRFCSRRGFSVTRLCNFS